MLKGGIAETRPPGRGERDIYLEGWGISEKSRPAYATWSEGR